MKWRKSSPSIHSPTIVVLPITSSKKPILPVHTRVDDTDLLTDNSIVLAEQIRTNMAI